MKTAKCCGGRLAVVGALAVGLNTTSTSASGTCTCSFTVDNAIGLVYIDQSQSPIDVTADVTGGDLLEWQTAKEYTFTCESATLLALKAWDVEIGCRQGGFVLKCESTDPSSPWHYMIADRSWKAWGTSCTNGGSHSCPRAGAVYSSTPPGNWYGQIFRDIAWGDAELSFSGMRAVVGTPLSICSSSGPAWLFRSPHLGASWFLLQYGFVEGGLCASFASHCTESGCTGDEYTDLHLAACDKTDPYQLFKLEFGRLVSAAPGYRCLRIGNSRIYRNGGPYTLDSCDWNDDRQEFVREKYDWSTVWRNPSTSRTIGNENGDNVIGNKLIGFTGTDERRKFNPIPAKEYVVTRRVQAGADARTACGSFGALAMPKTAEEQAALEADLAAYSGSIPLASLGGGYINGSWRWDDGTAVTYANWANGELSPYPWLCINTRTFKWHQCRDNEFYAAICDTGNPVSTTETPTASPTASGLQVCSKLLAGLTAALAITCGLLITCIRGDKFLLQRPTAENVYVTYTVYEAQTRAAGEQPPPPCEIRILP